MYKSRGVANTGYNVPNNAGKEEEGEKRERDLFHHTTHSRSICRCDLEPDKGQREVIHVPIDSGPFCVDQNWLYFGTAVSR